jgi:hypothetical protein
VEEELVVIATFANDAEAQMARAVLAAHDIPAAVLRDNAGGMLPALDWLVEIRLAVRRSDETVARSVLSSEAE